MNITRIFRTRYRIVYDALFKLYAPQYRYWWSPFYINLGINEFPEIEDAEARIHNESVERFKVIKYID